MLVKKLEEVRAIFDRIEAEHSEPPEEKTFEIHDDMLRETVAIANDMDSVPPVLYELDQDCSPRGTLTLIRDDLKALRDRIINKARCASRQMRADPSCLVASYCKRGATLRQVAEKHGTNISHVVQALKEFPQVRKREQKQQR